MESASVISVRGCDTVVEINGEQKTESAMMRVVSRIPSVVARAWDGENSFPAMAKKQIVSKTAD